MLEPDGRIPAAVGALLDAAHAEVALAERALLLARQHLERLARVHLVSAGIDPTGRRVDRDAAGWFHAAVPQVHGAPLSPERAD